MAGPELGKAYVNIIPKAPGMKNNMQKLLDGGTPSASSNGQKIGNSMLSGLKSVFAAAAVGKVIKDAIDAGADLQQSYGGLDTIYGNAATAAKKYAGSAALAGISANSYAEQAVSFGAALKQAYGGDTTKAMEAANTAIMDMADNSAKMGTPLQDIQNAYQGFAKQNYTMLDNLKLGYGGTQIEMKRLLADAQELTGIEYDISNLGDVYDAIHVIQEDLELTGVAALEARTTMTGSANAMKASWTNLMAAISTGHGLETALSNLGTTVGYFADNLIGMLVNISDTFPGLLQRLPAAITEFAPKLVSGGAQIVANLATGLAQAFPALVQQLPAMGQSILTAFKGIDWMTLGRTITDGAVTGFVDLLAMLPGLVGDILTGIITNAPALIEGGAELIRKLMEGLARVYPEMLDDMVQMVFDLVDTVIDAAPNIAAAAEHFANSMFDGLKRVAESIKSWWDGFVGSLQAPNITTHMSSSGRTHGGSSGSWGGHAGSFATGLDYVPYDNFLANLHKGEMVVPSRLASQLRQAGINRNTRDLSTLQQGGQPATVQTVTKIEFTGDLAQLARVLNPIITQEQHYLGEAFVT